MSVEVVEQTANSNIDFLNTFSWYKSVVGEILNSASQDFWEKSFEYKLISISITSNALAKNTNYFVTQVKLHEKISSSIKLSQNTIDVFLESALGDNGSSFEIDSLTELEAKILTSYNHHLHQELSQLFVSDAKIKTLVKENELNQDYLSFIFLLKTNDKPCGKTLITLPSQILKASEPLPPSAELLSEKIFENSLIDINIFVGKTTTTLQDVKMLESGDIIILEKSDISKMQVKGDFDFEFNLNPDPMLVYNYQEDEQYESGEENMSETANDKNRWDLINVDMSAEFEKIKMPLGELRQISKGHIIDLAPVYKNKVTLKVENNSIASGELVIIDDRYGVLLDEVLTEEEREEQTSQAAPVKEKTAKTTASDDDEDFDLEDFDIDDDLDDDLDNDFDDEDI